MTVFFEISCCRITILNRCTMVFNYFGLPIYEVFHICIFSIFIYIGKLAAKMYESMRREAAAINLQKNLHGYIARKSCTALKSSAIVLQTGFRAMSARAEFRLRKETKASIAIQVISIYGRTGLILSLLLLGFLVCPYLIGYHIRCFGFVPSQHNVKLYM